MESWKIVAQVGIGLVMRIVPAENNGAQYVALRNQFDGGQLVKTEGSSEPAHQQMCRLEAAKGIQCDRKSEGCCRGEEARSGEDSPR